LAGFTALFNHKNPHPRLNRIVFLKLLIGEVWYSMSSNSIGRQSFSPILAPLTQSLAALVGGMALFVFLLVAAAVSFNVVYAGRIYPGISVSGVDLSGLSPADASARLSERLSFPQNGKIVFQDGGKVWIVKPSGVGLFLDAENSALAAYSLGRSGWPWTRLSNQFDAWYSRVDLPPVLVYDQRMAQQYLAKLADELDRPTVEASLNVNGVDVTVTPGQVGRSLDIPVTLASLETQLHSMSDGIIPLKVVETPPAIMDASQQAEIARKILSAPLNLTLTDAQPGDPGPFTFQPAKLAEMLAIEKVQTSQGARYQVGLNTEKLRPFLDDLASKVGRSPEDARFTFNDDTRQLDLVEHAINGRTLDVEASLQSINQKLGQGEHNIGLVVKLTPPAVGDDATAQKLGIKELVSSQTTYFYGSSAERIHNIKVASGRFHGLLIPPGAVFSMAQYMGDVSLDTGYAEALIIVGNRTIKGVGGGVCQVSTTLFRTVFFGGYPVLERYPHAYRVGYYEQTASGADNVNMAGMDATVFVPVVDFKFKNDSPYWLLMETYSTKTSLTWKFYSTSDGRKVDWNTSGVQNIVDPPAPLYQENPDLAKGKIRQVDWAAQGADVTVTRTVTRDGQVITADEFTTHYLPWQAVFEYGPGTSIPND
jgi:vancomycin resistance protein YoaR